MKDQPEPETITEQALIIVLAIVLATLVRAWFVMIALGVVHAHVLSDVRPVGYGLSIVLSVLLVGASVILRTAGRLDK